MSSLNPLHTIEKQINEVILTHTKFSYVEAAKKTKQLLEILDKYNMNKTRKIIFVTVAGMSNALSGVVTCNTHHPVIACPPHSDKIDMLTNINSTLQMPSKVPVATILQAENCVLFCKKIVL